MHEARPGWAPDGREPTGVRRADRGSDQTRTAQRHVFWASYLGWLLDGFDTTIYAFLLVPGAGTNLGSPGGLSA